MSGMLVLDGNSLASSDQNSSGRNGAPRATIKLARLLTDRMLTLADVAVVVSDAKASAKWWKSKLGFETFTIGGSGHAVMVAPPGDRFVLHLCEGFAPLEPGDTGIAFVTDEIDKVVTRMKRGKVNFPDPVRAVQWGKVGKFADPDGNVFWLMEAPSAMVAQTKRTGAPKMPGASRKGKGTGPRKKRNQART